MMKPRIVISALLILTFMAACGQAAAPTPTPAPPTATQIPPTDTPLPTATAIKIPPTKTPTKTRLPPTQTPIPILLQGTKGPYRLTGVKLDRGLLSGGISSYPLAADFTLLELKFECSSGTNLLMELDPIYSVATNVYLRNGFPAVFVTDSQKKNFLAISLSTCSMLFPVPANSRGFVLHFKSLPALEIGQ